MIYFNRFGYKGGDRSTLVFIHGAGMDSTVWASQARYFAARGFEVLAPDLPGHGRSPGRVLLSIEDMAASLNAELNAKGLEDVYLIGHSMGSLIALKTAQMRPNSTLFLLGTAATMPVHPALIEAAENDLPLAAAMIADWGFLTGTTRQIQAFPSSSLTWAARRLLERSQAGVLANDLKACAEFKDAGICLAAQSRETTIIAGQHDRMTPVTSARELLGAGQVNLHIVENTGHMMLVEAPAKVRRLIADSLS